MVLKQEIPLGHCVIPRALRTRITLWKGNIESVLAAVNSTAQVPKLQLLFAW